MSCVLNFNQEHTEFQLVVQCQCQRCNRDAVNQQDTGIHVLDVAFDIQQVAQTDQAHSTKHDPINKRAMQLHVALATVHAHTGWQ
jgi:hypothetical protein